jgi:antitoxin PrlF
MAASKSAETRSIVTATVTSKGQITIPIEIRRSLGVKPGDKVRFERSNGGIRITNDGKESVFERYRGIGTGFPIKGKGRMAVVRFVREMRGHDDLD